MRDAEAHARDAALDNLEATRAMLIASARAIATRLAQTQGTVTGPQVHHALLEGGFAGQLAQVDARFLGAVFREGSGWRRVGWATGPESGSSHARPVAIWALK